MNHDHWFVLHREKSSDFWCPHAVELSKETAISVRDSFLGQGQQAVLCFGTYWKNYH